MRAAATGKRVVKRKDLLHGLIALAIAIVVARSLFVHDCERGGAMAGAHRTCQCLGVERLVSDQTAADGPRHSACYGLVANETCFRHRGGPQVECAGIDFGAPR